MQLQSSFSHPFLSGIHKLSTEYENISVNSCNNEAVICFDWNGQVQDLHFLVEHEKLMRRVGRETASVDRSTDFREKRKPHDEQPFHVNEVQRTKSGLEVSLHKLGMVYDLHQNKPVVHIPSTDIHDGRSYGTRAYINDMGTQRVVKVIIGEEDEEGEIEGQGQINVMQNAAWTTGLSVVAQKAIFKVLRGVSRLLPGRAMPEYNCRPNWLRGLQVVDENHVLVGMSPAAIALVNLE